VKCPTHAATQIGDLLDDIYILSFHRHNRI